VECLVAGVVSAIIGKMAVVLVSYLRIRAIIDGRTIKLGGSLNFYADDNQPRLLISTFELRPLSS